jgi:hypothetical protein
VEKNRVDIEELRFWCKYWYKYASSLQLNSFEMDMMIDDVVE